MIIIAKHLRIHIIGRHRCKSCNIRFTQKALARHNRLAHTELATDSVPLPIHPDLRRDERNTPERNPSQEVKSLLSILISPLVFVNHLY